MDACTPLTRTANAAREVPTRMILVVLALVGLASPLQAQALSVGQADQRPFVEGGVLTGGMGPDELLHRFGVSAEFAVPVYQDPNRVGTLRARAEKLSGYEDDRVLSLSFGLASRFNPRVALEGTVGYAAGWGPGWNAYGGGALGVGVPITLANRLAIAPRVSCYLLVGKDLPFGFLPVATLGVNVRVRL